VTLLIRTARSDDVPVLVEIEQQSFSRPHWDPDSFLKHDCLVAEVEGRIAGFLVSREIFPAVRGQPPEREILNVAVATVYRRLGVATALLERELSRNATYYLEVRESNAAAQQLYSRLGFIRIGLRPKYYEFPSEAAIVMQMKRC